MVLIFLTSVSDKLQLVTAQAVNVDVYVGYGDVSAGVVTFSRLNTKITTVATTDILPAPAASTTRKVKSLHISNVHASSSVGITLQHTDGTNVVLLESLTLLAGERLSYVEGRGFKYVDASGVEKTNPVIQQGQYQVARLSADVSNATVTAAKVTGLDLLCGVGTWIYEYFLIWQSSLATTGPKLSINHTGTVGKFLNTAYFLTSTTTDSLGSIDQDALVPQVMSGMSKRAKDATATMIATGGVDTINLDTLIQITGIATVTVAGNLELWFASETANATILRADSNLRLTKVG